MRSRIHIYGGRGPLLGIEDVFCRPLAVSEAEPLADDLRHRCKPPQNRHCRWSLDGPVPVSPARRFHRDTGVIRHAFFGLLTFRNFRFGRRENH